MAKQKSAHRADPWLAIIVFILVVIGIIMITSIGVPKSIKLSAPDMLYPNCSHPDVDCYLLLKKHVTRVAIGLMVCLVMAKINFRFWKKLALPLFVAGGGLLVGVLIFGSAYNTIARSWLSVYGGSFQPSEIAKLVLIFYFAKWLSKRGKELRSFRDGFLPFCVIMGVIVLPVILQPDLGSVVVIGAIAVTIFFVAGGRKRDILLGAVIAAMIAAVLFANVSYLKQRFLAFTAPDENCVESYCWQSEQARIAVGSGGFWGKGLTQGIQKSYWLPQASDDFIFAASAEELGFLKTGAIVVLFMMLGYRGFRIAEKAPNRFGALVAVGITTWITVQAFLNIAVNTSLLPVTGITLPFISYGGTSMVSLLMAVGILLNISKYTVHASAYNRRRDRRTYLPKYRRLGRA